MADKKITQLTNITGANLAEADEFVVVDITADETKAITFSELKTAFDTGTGFVRITGDTMTGDLSFGDNDKAIFGAGSDLEISSNGASAIIRAGNASSDIRLESDNRIVICDRAFNETFAVFNDDDDVKLYHNNAAKLATTSTGINVTGTVTADGLTVDGSSQTTSLLVNTGSTAWADSNADDLIIRGADVGITISSSATGGINFGDSTSATKQGQITYTHSGDNLDFYTATNKRLGIAGNGDISFYEDTGTTAKFFWDSSAESLDLTGAGGLDVNTATGSVNIQAGNASADIALGIGSPSTANKVVVTAGGSVGIGTDNPTGELEVKSTGDADLYIRSGDSNAGSIYFASASDSQEAAIRYFNSNNSLRFYGHDMAEAMRIDSSGNLLVGTTDTSPYDRTSGNAIAMGDGLISSAQSGGNAAIFNRMTSVGSIIGLNYNGSAIGSIGVQGSRPYFGNSINFSIKCDDANNGSLVPSNQSGVPNNNVSDIGLASNRWNDLYLGGGVYLGGTGSANKLDDYEEGSFAPVYAISGGSVTTGTNAGRYVKVGSFVFFTFRIRTTAVSGTGVLSMTLPFATASENRSGGSKGYARDWGVDMPEFSIYTPPNSSVVLFYRHAMNASTAQSVTGSQMGTGSDDNVLEGSIVYKSA